MAEAMMERIARALFSRDPHWARDFTWETAPEDARFRFRGDARAAVEAMRHATADMENAARTFVRPYHDIGEQMWRMRMPDDLFRLAWRAMISALLTEGGRTPGAEK